MVLHFLTFTSGWWGKSFVAELSRISERADKKIKMRRESVQVQGTDGKPLSTNSPHQVKVEIPTREKENGDIAKDPPDASETSHPATA